ncbi:MAG: RNA polymerase sigma-54 factor, partial [Acidobacteriota bacterium]|nr:RNA polymerase sigma-54 factor [Acidobacteriota bacterium]
MALKQKLALQLQQRLVMTPALQMAIRLLQLNRLELENVLQQEMVDNPMLEEREGPEESVDIAVPADEVGIEGQEQGDAEESLPEDVNSFDEINIE